MQTVYWSVVEWRDVNTSDFTLAYKEPERLRDNIPKKIAGGSYAKCPAFYEHTKNTFVLQSPVTFRFKFDPEKKEYATDNEKLFQSKFLEPDPSGIVQFKFGYVFFAENPLMMSQMHPFLHNNTFTRNGSIVYGEFDIGKWLRNLAMGIVLDPAIKEYEFNIKESDVYSYIRFHTEDRVNLKRFEMTNNVHDIANKCFDYKLRKSKGVDSLQKCYDIFTKSLYHKRLIKEIKKNLIE